MTQAFTPWLQVLERVLLREVFDADGGGGHGKSGKRKAEGAVYEVEAA